MVKQLVSVNISCYNRSKMLQECLISFLNQTYENFEVIVVDDGSEEDLSWVKNYSNWNGFKYYRQNHSGMNTGLNFAKSVSSGEFILPFGSDDIAHEDLIEKEVEILENNPEIDIVFCDQWLMKNGRLKRKKYNNINLNNQDKFYQEMLEKQIIPHGGSLWRKNKYLSLDLDTGLASDWELMLTAIENGYKFYHIPERLWTYRVGHSDRDSLSKQMDIDCEKVMKKRGRIFNNKTRKGEKYGISFG